MNISSQLATAAAPTTAKRVDTPKPTATSANVAPTANVGPAAKVAISNKARATLRAAGMSPSDIAQVNLTDKNAVARALQKARMNHGKLHASTTSAANGPAQAATVDSAPERKTGESSAQPSTPSH
jgi:hypothetical protein